MRKHRRVILVRPDRLDSSFTCVLKSRKYHYGRTFCIPYSEGRSQLAPSYKRTKLFHLLILISVTYFDA